MNQQQVAARDTTFDNIIPERIWINHRSSSCRKYIVWYLEINGIEKEMSRFYVGSYDGILSESHQLSWILKNKEKIDENPCGKGKTETKT